MGELKIQSHKRKISINKPILIEGLPGIGNVGKIAVDFMVDELKAEKIYSFFSYSFPHTVFVNENNLVELPTIDLYYKRLKGRDLLFLAGDVQPIDEKGSYEFTDKILEMAQQFNLQEVITLGGIGLKSIPKQPKIYCTANSKKIIQKYKKGVVLNEKLYGVVGPIVGISGIMLGLAKRRNIQAISFLAETYGHPMHIGLKGSREIINLLNKKLNLGINLNKLDKDILELEKESFELGFGSNKDKESSVLRKVRGRIKRDVEYIG